MAQFTVCIRICICRYTNLHLPSGFWGRSQNPGDDSYYTIGPSGLEEVFLSRFTMLHNQEIPRTTTGG